MLLWEQAVELVRLLASIFVIMVRLPVYLTEEKNDWKNYATGQKKRIKGCILIQVTREITAISPEWQNKLSDVLGK